MSSKPSVMEPSLFTPAELSLIETESDLIHARVDLEDTERLVGKEHHSTKHKAELVVRLQERANQQRRAITRRKKR